MGEVLMKILYILGMAATAALAVQDIKYKKINILGAGAVWGMALTVRILMKEPMADIIICIVTGMLFIGVQKNYISTRGCRELDDKMLMSRVQDIDIVCRFQALAGQMQCKVTIHGSMPFSLQIFGFHEASFEVSANESMPDAIKYLWQKH